MLGNETLQEMIQLGKELLNEAEGNNGTSSKPVVLRGFTITFTMLDFIFFLILIAVIRKIWQSSSGVTNGAQPKAQYFLAYTSALFAALEARTGAILIGIQLLTYFAFELTGKYYFKTNIRFYHTLKASFK